MNVVNILDYRMNFREHDENNIESIWESIEVAAKLSGFEITCVRALDGIDIDIKRPDETNSICYIHFNLDKEATFKQATFYFFDDYFTTQSVFDVEEGLKKIIPLI